LIREVYSHFRDTIEIVYGDEYERFSTTEIKAINMKITEQFNAIEKYLPLWSLRLCKISDEQKMKRGLSRGLIQSIYY